MESAPIALHHRLDPEDRARANFYAILAALFADAPDAKLLATVGATDLLEDAEAGELPLAWNRLVAACRVMDPEAARQEHTDLFVGTGRTEVNLHGSHWRSGFMMEKPLVELRRDLAALGLGAQARKYPGRGPHLGAVRDDAPADRGGFDAFAGKLERTEGFLRDAHWIVGLRFVHCTKKLFACQLLSSGSRICRIVHGART